MTLCEPTPTPSVGLGAAVDEVDGLLGKVLGSLEHLLEEGIACRGRGAHD